MNNNTTDPVLDPSITSSYYTCVDIELVPPGTLGNTGTPDPADEPASGEGEQGGSSQAAGESETPLIPTAPPSSDTPAMTGAGSPTPAPGDMMAMNDMMGAGTQAPSTGTAAPSASTSDSSSGGCNLATGGARGTHGLAAFAMFAALGLRRRSRVARS
jgi:hypothetical protein